MPINVTNILSQIDQALAEHQELVSKSRYSEHSDQSESDVTRVNIRLANTIDRLAPPASYHRRRLDQFGAHSGTPGFITAQIAGTLAALRRDYELGHTQSISELIHADTAVSFIEMAEDLRGQGYKDAAAVIAGSVLEQHLRDLAAKNQIAVQANGKYKKAETLNAELAASAVYSKLDQKNVTSWLGLRNEAAHGNYTAYSQEQVHLLIQAIQDFMARLPA